MTKKSKDGPSARDPLSQILGDPTLDSVWRDVQQGQSTPAGRAALIAHYRKQREQYIKKRESDDAAS